MNRFHRVVLISATLLASWLGMQAVHELGHVLGASATGGRVSRVILHPLTISRTELARNPHPLIVVWAGPLVGVLLPLLAWACSAALRLPGTFLLRFFAGFCLIANRAYVGAGSFERIGDCGTMLHNGSSPWQLWLFGLMTVPSGLALWHRQGPHFGLGKAEGKTSWGAAYAVAFVAGLLVALGLLTGPP